MKNLIILFTFYFFASNCFSQNCSKFYSFDEDTTFQITNYDKKGKTVGFVDYTVTNVRIVEGTEVATIASVVKDKKGEPIIESSYDISCIEDKISIDFNSLVNPQMLGQYGAMDVEISGTNIDLPNNLFVGRELTDASMLMSVSMGITFNLTVDITGRKVIAEETVTTPAGAFNCFVLTQEVVLKMGFKTSGTSKQWIAEGIGLVKQEEYDKKGKVTSSSLLTAFSR